MSRMSFTARIAVVILTLVTAAACSSPTGPGKAGQPTYDQSNPNIR